MQAQADLGGLQPHRLLLVAEDHVILAARQIVVGDVPCLALRVTYGGELGWELIVPTEFAADVAADLDALRAANLVPLWPSLRALIPPGAAKTAADSAGDHPATLPGGD